VGAGVVGWAVGADVVGVIVGVDLGVEEVACDVGMDVEGVPVGTDTGMEVVDTVAGLDDVCDDGAWTWSVLTLSSGRDSSINIANSRTQTPPSSATQRTRLPPASLLKTKNDSQNGAGTRGGREGVAAVDVP
jgi:hypothetical protein